VCPLPTGDEAACVAIAVANADGSYLRSVQPLDAAFTPTDIQKAYNLKGLKSHGATVAIIDAFGYTSLESDLAKYRSTYDLPECTTKNKCLRIVDQRGGHDLPPEDPGWALEQALDVDAVSAACPDCKILVVQADSNGIKSLSRAVQWASKQPGVVAVSNSYGGHDRRHQFRGRYSRSGVAITASTGDSGWQGGSYPADDPHVVAVGGTSVHRTFDNSRGYTESAWSGAGSGCSMAMRVPSWQKDVKTTCKTRAMSDVSAAADPNFGGLSIVYHGGFQQVGGTSESSPLIAAVYALSGHTEKYPARIPYEKSKYLYDVTSGSNGSCGAPLCSAGKGWDGPTGMGTPNGVKGF
jgi:subtilase family serine protease